MFPEPSTPGPPAPDTPPDSSRISHGPGEQDLGRERRETAARILLGGIRSGRTRAGGLENPGGIVVGILDCNLNEMEKEQVCKKIKNQIKGCEMERNLGWIGELEGPPLPSFKDRETDAQAGVKASKSIGS